jgi:hypothetical protein
MISDRQYFSTLLFEGRLHNVSKLVMSASGLRKNIFGAKPPSTTACFIVSAEMGRPLYSSIPPARCSETFPHRFFESGRLAVSAAVVVDGLACPASKTADNLPSGKFETFRSEAQPVFNREKMGGA